MDSVVCGIDPGLGTTGYAVVRGRGETRSIVDAGVFRLDRATSLSDRLVAVHDDITAVISEHRPDLVAVEALYAHYKHPRTSILMAHARGVILLSAASAGCRLRSYEATRVKKYLTGSGRATKMQMQRAVQASLGLENLPEPSDLADALAIALCCLSELHDSSFAEAAR